MKKLLISLVALLSLSFAAQAQDYDFTAGVRVGYGAAFTLEASGQVFVNDINRIEVDLGMRFSRNTSVKDIYYPYGPILTTAWHWHWFLAGGFGVYGGPALQFSLPAWHHFSMGAGAQVGLDYQFDAPFQISVDFRPIYNFFGPFHGYNGKQGFDPNVAIGLRYAF